MAAQTHWIVTADERVATLYSVKKAPAGRWHVEPGRTLQNRWEDSHEHHRPSSLGRGPSANAAQHFASWGHEAEEEQRRFAREVRDWLGHAVKELQLDHLTVFAAPKFLGMLRQELQSPGRHPDLKEAELTHLRAHELAEHPQVLLALAETTV